MTSIKKKYWRFCDDLENCFNHSIDSVDAILAMIEWNKDIKKLPFKNFKDDFLDNPSEDIKKQKAFTRRVLKFRRLQNIYNIKVIDNEVCAVAKGVNAVTENMDIPLSVARKKFQIIFNGTKQGKNVAGDGFIVKPSRIVKAFIYNSKTYDYDDYPLITKQNQLPRIYYKGYNLGDTRRIQTGNPIWDSFIFMSTDLHQAENYGSTIDIIILKRDARILAEREARALFKIYPHKGKLLLDYHVKLCLAARDAGYAGIEFEHQGDTGTIIFDQKWIKTRMRKTT